MTMIAKLVVMTGCLLLAGQAVAQQMFVFPANGQSAQQQTQDEAACDAWATEQSGFNPANVGAAPRSNQVAQGGLLRGGARGAAVGAVTGAISGNAGRGASAGAAGGALIGGMRRNDQRRQQDADRRAWERQQNAGRESWRRAKTACLVGKGYTVS